MPISNEPVRIDLYTARAQWHALLHAVYRGQSFTITRGGYAFALLSPTSPITPSDPSSLLDPDTAQRIRTLVDHYQPHTLATMLMLPDDVLARLTQTGVVNEALFRRIIILETLAQIIFSSMRHDTGRRWLARPHPQLKHHPPLYVLRRALLQDEQLTAKVLELARKTFQS